MNRFLVACGALWLTGWTGIAMCQESAAETPAESAAESEEPAAAVDPLLIRIHLMDGSLVAGRLSVEVLEVETAFGSLLVPITSIESFTPGLASHPEVARNIASLIEDLGSNVYGQRETSQKALLKLGPPIRRELEQQANDADNERRTRIKEILEEFDMLQADEEEQFGEGSQDVLIQRDLIETPDFTIVGKIVPQSFVIRSQYGELNVKLADIRRGEREAPVVDLRKSVKVQGANLTQKTPLSTGIRLKRGDQVSLNADGTITMTPWGNEASSTPEGAPNYGWFMAGQIPNGSLVARVGTSGPWFKAGGKLSFTADRPGTLYLGLAIDNNFANNNFPGEFRVRLHVKQAPVE